MSAPALVFDHVPHQLELTGRHRDIVLVTALCSVGGRNFAVRLMITIVHCACAPWERTRAIRTLDFVHWELFPLVANPLPAGPTVLKGRQATLPEEAPTHNEVAQGLRRVHVLCRLYDARVKELSQTRMQLTNVGVWPKRHACALTIHGLRSCTGLVVLPQRAIESILTHGLQDRVGPASAGSAVRVRIAFRGQPSCRRSL